MNVTQPAEPSQSVRDRLLADHRRFDRLLDRFVAFVAADDREALQPVWTELETRLSFHMELEERYLVPTLSGMAGGTVAAAILDEHAKVRHAIAEMGEAIDLHLVRLTSARALKRLLDDHARKEDVLLYGWSESRLDEAARRSLLDALED